ncbi:MAG: SsrA-binding protein SmpB [Candidatus Eisenbacteria sp.]|nr:SsrA-binding protein SmpB [Candidatus Eisenbacteria bacterium]
MIISSNRRARREYQILDTFEAGLVLTGAEVKSVRAGKVNLKDSYARIENGEVFLYNMHIASYEKAAGHPHDPDRRRKLLLNASEIRKLLGRTVERGLTLVPLDVHFAGPWAKVQLALARGKKTVDKRRDIAERDARREMERARRGNR